MGYVILCKGTGVEQRLEAPMILLLAALLQDTSILYQLPDVAKDQEAEKVVRILKGRLDDAKVSGIKVISSKRDGIFHVEFRSASPIGENVRDAIQKFTSVQGTDVRILFRRELSLQEKDDCKPGEKAPAGCRWIPDGNQYILVDKLEYSLARDIRWSEGDKTQQHRFIPAGTPYFEIPAKRAPELDKNEMVAKAILLIDGQIVRQPGEWHHPETPTMGTRITGGLASDKILGICVNRPLAYTLKKAD